MSMKESKNRIIPSAFPFVPEINYYGEQSAYCVKFNFYYLTYFMQALILLTSVYSFHIGYYAGTFFGFVAVGLSLIPTLVHRKMPYCSPLGDHFFDRPHAVSSYWRILISLVP